MADLKRLYAEGVAAYNVKDIGAFERTYAEAELIVPGRPPLTGWAQISAYWRDHFNAFPEGMAARDAQTSATFGVDCVECSARPR